MSANAYVANFFGNSISVVDVNTNTIVTTIPLTPNDFPLFTKIQPTGIYVYITVDNTDKVLILDTRSNTIVSTINLPAGSEPSDLAFTPDGSFVYVANNGNGTVSVIDTTTHVIVATIPVGSSPLGVAVTPNGQFVYVTNFGSNSVSIIATATNTVVATIPLPGQPGGIEITPDGTRAYVPFDDNSVAVITTSTNTVTTTFTLPGASGSAFLTISPDGTTGYIVNENSNNVSVVNLSTNTQTALVPVGEFPFDVAVKPGGQFVYVTNIDSDSISVISTAMNSVVFTIDFTAGSGPAGISIMPQLANRLVNGGFETGQLEPWVGVNAMIDTRSRTGQFSARLTGGTANSILYQIYQIDPGEEEEVIVSLSKIGSSNIGSVLVEVLYYDSNFNFLGIGLISIIPVSKIPDFTQNGIYTSLYQMVIPSSPNATQAIFLIDKLPDAGSPDILVDDAVILADAQADPVWSNNQSGIVNISPSSRGERSGLLPRTT